MTNIRRYFREGNLYFLTHVTHNRRPILVDNHDLLLEAIESKLRRPTMLHSWVVLPDHLHMIVDPDGCDLSILMRQFKLSFSSLYRRRTSAGKGRVWQYRFWDHQIRDENDLTRHLDYIHYNPVKHGLTSNPFAWEFSSIHGFREKGYYEDDWGVIEKPECDGEYGE